MIFTADPDLTQWPFVKKQAFRFFFIFFILYIFLTPNDVLPYSYMLRGFYKQPSVHIICWFSKNIFHIALPVNGFNNGVTDTTFGYVSILFIGFCAMAGSIIWMIVDRKKGNYSNLYRILILVLRYYLAITWIAYGSLKIIQLQFPPITPVQLLQTYGNSSPRALAWAFMGYSAGYNYFIGIAEYIIGLLLFFRKTSTLGNFMGFITLANVMAFNYCFDVNVKLLSTVLMTMTLFLLLKDITGLISFFWHNKATSVKYELKYHFNKKWKKTVILIVKYGFITYVLFFDLRSNIARAKQNGYGAKKPPLYGIYNVQTFIRNKDTVKPLTTDTTRWKSLTVSSKGKASVMLMNDSLLDFTFNVDTLHQKIEMYTTTGNPHKYTFVYSRPKSNMLLIKGKCEKDSLTVQFQQYDLNNFPLNNNGFHWIIDHQVRIKR